MTFTEIQAEARRIAKAKGNTYSIDDLTSSANRALERVTSLIRDAEGRWQWDDSNNTDFPSAVHTITSGQQDYELDPTHYRIERVEIKDSVGTWTKLIPFDQKDVEGTLTDFLSGTGLPQYYDKLGNSILLYPTPNYTQVSSLKVFYQRGPSYFTTTDTTKTPGFNPLFHQLVALWCAYDYAFIEQKDIADDLFKDHGNGIYTGRIPVMENMLKDYYSLRDKDEHVRLSANRSAKFN